jgi:hypothetical protein
MSEHRHDDAALHSVNSAWRPGLQPMQVQLQITSMVAHLLAWRPIY